MPPPPPDSFSSDCAAPQPPVWLTLVEITWQNQFNVITQPRASSCLGERRSSRYCSRASPSPPSPPSPIYFSQMKMNYAFSSVTLAHKRREHIRLHLLLAKAIWGRYLLRWRCLNYQLAKFCEQKAEVVFHRYWVELYTVQFNWPLISPIYMKVKK